MYYVFSNAKELEAILNEGKYKELNRTFVKTKLKKKRKLRKGQMSAREKYHYICENVLIHLDERSRKAFRFRAVEIFAKAWDVETIQMIKLNPQLYGELTLEAKGVLEEYAIYTRIAKNTVYGMIFDESKEKMVPIGYDGNYIKVRYISNKLSFVRNGVEYVISENWV